MLSRIFGRRLLRPTDDWLSQAEGRFAELSEGTTHYHVHGSGKSTIVCIHGYSMCNLYHRFAPALLDALGTDTACVITYDLWGRGASDAPPCAMNTDSFTKQLHELLRWMRNKNEICDGPVTVVGASMGGSIAAHFTVTHADEVESLILLAPAGLGSSQPLLARVGTMPLIGEVFMPAFGPGVLKGHSTQTFGDAKDAETASKIKAEHEFIDHQVAGHPGFMRSLLFTLREFSFSGMEEVYRALGSAFSGPTLLLWGEADITVPYEPHFEQMKRFLPCATIHSIPNVAHDLLETGFDVCFPIIKDFCVEQIANNQSIIRKDLTD